MEACLALFALCAAGRSPPIGRGGEGKKKRGGRVFAFLDLLLEELAINSKRGRGGGRG